MSDWKECKLGDVLADKGYIRGPFGSSLKRGEMKESGIPVYEQKNAIYNSRGFRFFIDENKFQELSRFQVQTNDLIISCSGTVGKISIIKDDDTKGIISQALLILRPDVSKITLKYLYFLLSSKQGFELLTQASHGSVQINIAERKVVENIPLLLPPLPEQKAIASVLSSLDDKIDLLHCQNKILEAMAETLFRQWFLASSHDDSHVRKIIDVVQFTKGRKPKEVSELYVDGLIPQILIETFDTGKTLFSDPNNMVIAKEKDILMVMDGASSGRVEIGFEGIVGSTIGLFRCKEEFNYPLFLYHFLKLNEEYIKDNTTGSAIPHADKSLILDLDVEYHSSKVEQFEKTATGFFEKKQNNKKQISSLVKLRDTLLPKLMSGEVRVCYEEN